MKICVFIFFGNHRNVLCVVFLDFNQKTRTEYILANLLAKDQHIVGCCTPIHTYTYICEPNRSALYQYRNALLQAQSAKLLLQHDCLFFWLQHAAHCAAEECKRTWRPQRAAHILETHSEERPKKNCPCGPCFLSWEHATDCKPFCVQKKKTEN